MPETTEWIIKRTSNSTGTVLVLARGALTVFVNFGKHDPVLQNSKRQI